MKGCPICNEDDLSKFGICNSRPDGLNLYCKSCVQVKMKATRERQQQMKRARKQALRATEEIVIQIPKRKDVILSKPTPRAVDKVRDSISRGNRTREAIQMDTRLSMEVICDVLPDLLWEEKSICLIEVNGEKVFVSKKVA